MAFDFLNGKKHISVFLVTIQTPDGVFYRIVDEKSFSIGRSLDCALSFPDPNISRVHIVVSSKKDQIWLIDQGSANGTYINGQKAMANKLTLVQPNDDVKLGTSEIHLKFDLFEKAFKKDDLINSLLPDHEKSTLMEVIQGAHQQAKRIIVQAQEHYDKLVKSAEAKVRNVENSLLIKQDEIIQAATVQANQLVQEGKRKAAQIVFDAEEKAVEATKEIFAKAEEARGQADKYYQARMDEAQKEASEVGRSQVEMGQQMIQEASAKSQEISRKTQEECDFLKEKYHLEGEKIKESYLEDAKAEMNVTFSELQKSIADANKELERLTNYKAQEFQLEIEKRRKEMELSLEDLKNEITKNTRQRDFEIKKKEEELELMLRKQEFELEKQHSQKEIEFKQRVEELTYQMARQEKELQRMAELREHEINKRKSELDQIYQNHLHELEKTSQKKEQELRERVDQDLADRKHKISDCETAIQSLKKEIEQINESKKSSQKHYEVEEDKLSELRNSIQKTLNDKKSVEDSYQGLLRQIQQFDLEKKQSLEKVKELENRAGHLQMLVEGENTKILDLSREYDNRVRESKAKLDAEFALLRKDKEEQFRMSFDAEAENAKQLKDHMMQEIQMKQNLIIQDVHQKVLKVIALHAPKDALTQLSDSSLVQIQNAFEDNLASISAHNQVGKINTEDVRKRQKRVKVQFVTTGLIMGLLLSTGYHLWSDKLKRQTMASVVEQEQKARQAELDQRKFKPQQDMEVKDTYTDAVIYTQQFVELYADPQLQERWVREAREYFYKNWRIPEEITIEILSTAKTLVQSLNEKRQNIHPDFVDQNIKKMRELEDESVITMKDKFGTDVKFEAFKKFEKKFFMNELARRAPAEVYIDPNVEDGK